jgi:NTE family protein
MKIFKKRPKCVGLALGAGAARGWAHLGVLKAIEERGIHIDCIAGTSAGSLVGAVYASGSINELKEILLNLDWREVLRYFSDISFSRSGLVDGRKITAFLRENIHATTFDELPTRFKAVATDLKTGSEVVLSSGDVVEAIRASISFPGIFTPVPRDDQLLVDGGLVNPVPVNVVRAMGADVIIAVNVNHDRVGSISRRRYENEQAPDKTDDRPLPDSRVLREINEFWNNVTEAALQKVREFKASPNQPALFDVLGNSIRIMETQIADASLKVHPPEALITPDVGYISFMEFDKAPEAMEEGYRAAQQPLDDLQEQYGL